MSKAHRQLGTCAEVFPREGGWVAQVVRTSEVEVPEKERIQGQEPRNYDVEVLRGGLDTQEEAVTAVKRHNEALPIFYLGGDPDDA